MSLLFYKLSLLNELGSLTEKEKINKLKANLGSVCILASYLQAELSNSILRNTAGIIYYITCVNASEQNVPCRMDCHTL